MWEISNEISKIMGSAKTGKFETNMDLNYEVYRLQKSVKLIRKIVLVIALCLFTMLTLLVIIGYWKYSGGAMGVEVAGGAKVKIDIPKREQELKLTVIGQIPRISTPTPIISTKSALQRENTALSKPPENIATATSTTTIPILATTTSDKPSANGAPNAGLYTFIYNGPKGIILNGDHVYKCANGSECPSSIMRFVEFSRLMCKNALRRDKSNWRLNSTSEITTFVNGNVAIRTKIVVRRPLYDNYITPLAQKLKNFNQLATIKFNYTEASVPFYENKDLCETPFRSLSIFRVSDECEELRDAVQGLLNTRELEMWAMIGMFGMDSVRVEGTLKFGLESSALGTKEMVTTMEDNKVGNILQNNNN